VRSVQWNLLLVLKNKCASVLGLVHAVVARSTHSRMLSEESGDRPWNSGVIRHPLSHKARGRHSLHLKEVWDRGQSYYRYYYYYYYYYFHAILRVSCQWAGLSRVHNTATIFIFFLLLFARTFTFLTKIVYISLTDM
jgi:hypothetical protein